MMHFASFAIDTYIVNADPLYSLLHSIIISLHQLLVALPEVSGSSVVSAQLPLCFGGSLAYAEPVKKWIRVLTLIRTCILYIYTGCMFLCNLQRSKEHWNTPFSERVAIFSDHCIFFRRVFLDGLATIWDRAGAAMSFGVRLFWL